MPGTTIESASVNSDFSDIGAALTDSVAADGQTTLTGGIKAFPGSASGPSYTWASSPTDGFFLSGTHQIGLAINGAFVGFFNANGFNTTAGQPTGTPIGSIHDFAGSTAPSGWYLCYGQNVSRTTYAALFAVVGTTYGAGDGLTTFGLPDCRGRATFGQDNMGGVAANRITVAGGNFDGTVLGGVGGQQNQTLTTAQIASHAHSLVGGTAADSGHTHTIPDPGHNHSISQIATVDGGGVTKIVAQGVGGSGTNTANNTTGITTTNSGTANISLSGSSATAGSGSAHPVLSNAVIFNKVIFAGA